MDSDNIQNPFVKLAADDYRRALIRLRRHSKDTNALHTKIECELFFRKDIEMYSDMDGEVLIKGIQEAPEWMEGLNMFDDSNQLKIIQENNMVIEMANENISNAMEVINQNKRYKSVLYTSGDELVEVIFEILENMLGCDLSEFTDKKKEDFKFKLNDKVFIGEIKGVTPNVKKSNVSQLDVHVQEYLDDNDEESKNIVALLIINHQRSKPISAREGVNDEVIKLAERNGSLIVETITLLKLFEQYLLGEKNRDECIDSLVNNTGLLNCD